MPTIFSPTKTKRL